MITEAHVKVKGEPLTMIRGFRSSHCWFRRNDLCYYYVIWWLFADWIHKYNALNGVVICAFEVCTLFFLFLFLIQPLAATVNKWCNLNLLWRREGRVEQQHYNCTNTCCRYSITCWKGNRGEISPLCYLSFDWSSKPRTPGVLRKK